MTTQLVSSRAAGSVVSVARRAETLGQHWYDLLTAWRRVSSGVELSWPGGVAVSALLEPDAEAKVCGSHLLYGEDAFRWAVLSLMPRTANEPGRGLWFSLHRPQSRYGMPVVGGADAVARYDLARRPATRRDESALFDSGRLDAYREPRLLAAANGMIESLLALGYSPRGDSWRRGAVDFKRGHAEAFAAAVTDDTPSPVPYLEFPLKVFRWAAERSVRITRVKTPDAMGRFFETYPEYCPENADRGGLVGPTLDDLARNLNEANVVYRSPWSGQVVEASRGGVELVPDGAEGRHVYFKLPAIRSGRSVRAGDQVKAGQVLAYTPVPTRIVSLPHEQRMSELSRFFGVALESVLESWFVSRLLVVPGQPVSVYARADLAGPSARDLAVRGGTLWDFGDCDACVDPVTESYRFPAVPTEFPCQELAFWRYGVVVDTRGCNERLLAAREQKLAAQLREWSTTVA